VRGHARAGARIGTAARHLHLAWRNPRHPLDTECSSAMAGYRRHDRRDASIGKRSAALPFRWRRRNSRSPRRLPRPRCSFRSFRGRLCGRSDGRDRAAPRQAGVTIADAWRCRCVGQPSGAARWPLHRRAHRADRPDAPLTEPTKTRRSLRIIGSLARGRRLAASLGAAVDRREGESPRGSRLVGSGSEPAPRFDAAVRAGGTVHEGRCRSGETNSRRSRAPSSGSDLADMPAFEARAQARRGACLDRPLPSPDPNRADRTDAAVRANGRPRRLRHSRPAVRPISHARAPSVKA